MNSGAIFGIGILMSFVSAVVVAKLYVWPWLRARERKQALVTLVTPHLFLRFIGLSFLVPGVVSPALPKAFAVPAAFGDFGAGVLAIITAIAFGKRLSWAIPAAWLFNVWGAADLLYAVYEAPHGGVRPEMLGAAFYLPTAIVPLLLVSHFLIFGLLLRRAGSQYA